MAVVALIGPHAAGKSTLGRALAERLGGMFDLELGYERALRSAGAAGPDAGARPAAFDREVIEAELARDRPRGVGGVGAGARAALRVVETWHPGNLAYASARNPLVFERYLAPVGEAIRELQRRARVLVVPVTATDAALRRRFHEPGEPDELLRYFRRVEATALHLARAWDLEVLPTVDTTHVPVDVLAPAVARLVRRRLERETRSAA